MLVGLFGLEASVRAQTTCTATDTAVTAVNPTDADALAADCAALLDNKDTLRGTATLNWASTVSMATWQGITLTSTSNNVAGISLVSADLTGSIPDLSALTSLTSLRLNDNELSGSIVAAKLPTSLTSLRLRKNELSGSIPDLSALTNLTNLTLNHNKLSGSIPDLSALTSLTQLLLYNNELSGSIPDLSALTSLTNLWLNNNELSGSIPDLSALASLSNLYLHQNELSGSIPDLSALTSLTSLILNDNELSGSIPDLSDLTSLMAIFLSNNELSGSIPDLSDLTSLEDLKLSNNKLSGSIVAARLPTSLMNLYLDNNELSGSIPATLGTFSNLRTLHLAGNGFTGSIPSDLGSLTNLSDLSLCETDLGSAATLPTALETRRTEATLAVWSCTTLPENASAPEGVSLAFPLRHSTFPVRGTPGSTSVDVSWATIDGTATGGDYGSKSEDDPGSVTIPANTDTAASTSTATISVPTFLDGLEEGEESFTLLLVRLPGAKIVRIRRSATGTISDPIGGDGGGGGGGPPPDDGDEDGGDDDDDDGGGGGGGGGSPRPTVSVEGSRALESAGAVVFVVRLSAASSSAVTVDYATSDDAGSTGATAGTDYTATTGTLTFPAGSTAAGEIRVPVTDDMEDEAEAETFTLTLRNVSNGLFAGGRSQVQVTGTILDDDDPVVSFGSSSYEVPEGGTVQVSVELSGDPERELTIPLVGTHQGGATEADYSGVPASVTFSSGTTTREFQFSATEDSDEDYGESVLVGFGDLPSGVSGGAGTTVSIRDDDTPPMAAFDVVGAACDAELCRAVTGRSVRFVDTSSGPAEFLRWDFGDGAQSSLEAPDHGWSAPGFYEVTLRASDGTRESTASRTFLVEASVPAGTCEADAETRCLQDSRYSVVVDWWNGAGQSGSGRVVHAGTNDSGLFRFFDRDNWEVLIKVLDGCALNGHVWVFGASTTDLGYSIRVTDTVTETVKEYRNDPGLPAPAITDGRAFAESCRR